MDSQGTFVEALLSQSKSVIRLKTFASYEREEVMKTICAYLNGQGGWLVIGIDKIIATVLQPTFRSLHAKMVVAQL